MKITGPDAAIKSMSKYSFGLSKLLSMALIFAFFACGLLLIHFITPASFDNEWREVRIPEGSNYTEGLRILEKGGIIKGRTALLFLGKVTGSDKKLKPGYYNLSASMSPLDIFDTLIKGRTIQFTVTIPEGSTLEQIKKKFTEMDLMDEGSWGLVNDNDFIAGLGIDAPSLEGYLYPDTYRFQKGTAPETVLRRMVRRLEEVFDGSLQKRAGELGMTRNEVLTMASIIEKEAVFDIERPIISGVYHNRLKKRMRLQADPTVLYGLGKSEKRIRYRDLKRKTPYNTYVIRGLPPGPIASPGVKSIRAALYPDDVDFLFFVSKNDGTHQFSKTNREHARAVALYQLNGRGKK
jgi:UPF0755 protein